MCEDLSVLQWGVACQRGSVVISVQIAHSEVNRSRCLLLLLGFRSTSKKCSCLLSTEATSGRDHPFISSWQQTRGIKGRHWPENYPWASACWSQILGDPGLASGSGVDVCELCSLWGLSVKNEAGFVHTTVQRVLSQGMSATGVLALFPFWPANKPAAQLRWSSGDEKDIRAFMMYSEI